MTPTRLFPKFSAIGFVAIVTLFALCAFALIAFTAIEFWHAVQPFAPRDISSRFNGILKCIAMLTIAMASLELADTVVEEEFRSEHTMSAPARIRRVLSRFLVVVIVSLSIESLVAVFQLVHEDPSQIVQAAYIALAAAILLAGWGLFLKLDRPATRNE